MATNTAENGTIESREDYKDTPAGQYKFYAEELKASQKMLKKWHKKADKITNKFLGKAAPGEDQVPQEQFKLNLFNSNVTTLKSMLYGNTPKIDVSRRFTDQNDDVGRVAGEVMQRMLNMDVQSNGQEIDCILQSALSDRLVEGLGCARVRYDVQTAMEGEEEVMIDESAPVEYYHWGDVLWGWARTWAELPWLAYRSYLTKDEVAERFGKEYAEKVTLKQQKANSSDESEDDADMAGPWKKAEIWEIWDKAKRKVVWISLGCDKVLDTKEDPLGLTDFFPSPPFLMANPSTSLYIPTPDYTLSQDLYNEIDVLQERISILTQAVKAVGVYDASAEAIKNMLNSGVDNELIPVENWALFGEKQGLKGQIDWMPLAEIVNALDKLRELRSEAIGLLQQITGMSDVMRGGLDSAYEGVGQSEMKAKFGSVRVQALQDQFAKFATDLFQIKAEIICKHFSPQTIAQKSNMQYSPDRDVLPQAIQLIKDYDKSKLRVDIRPESVAMVDYAQLKNERTEYITALATFMQSAGPLIESDPSAKPFLLQLLQWGLAGFKGASEIEGVVDKAIEAAQAQNQEGQEKPDPEMQKMQMQAQQDDKKHQAEMQKIQAKAQADMQLREQDYQFDIRMAREQHNMKMQEVAADMQRSLAETTAKLEADAFLESLQTESNLKQTRATMQGEIEKDVVTAELEAASEAGKTRNKIDEIREGAMSKIAEGRAQVYDAQDMKDLESDSDSEGDDD